MRKIFIWHRNVGNMFREKWLYILSPTGKTNDSGVAFHYFSAQDTESKIHIQINFGKIPRIHGGIGR